MVALPDSALAQSRSWDLSVTSPARYRYTNKPQHFRTLGCYKNFTKRIIILLLNYSESLEYLKVQHNIQVQICQGCNELPSLMTAC